MSATDYVFTSKNKGDVTVSVSGHYVDGCVDIDVQVEGGDYKEFCDIDAGGVDEIFEWLIESGVEFESVRSMWLSWHYVESVMIDRDVTEAQLLDKAASISEEQLAEWRDLI